MVMNASFWLYAIVLIFILTSAILLYRHKKAVNARIKLEQEEAFELEYDLTADGRRRAHAMYDPSEGMTRFTPLKRRKKSIDK